MAFSQTNHGNKKAPKSPPTNETRANHDVAVRFSIDVIRKFGVALRQLHGSPKVVEDFLKNYTIFLIVRPRRTKNRASSIFKAKIEPNIASACFCRRARIEISFENGHSHCSIVYLDAYVISKKVPRGVMSSWGGSRTARDFRHWIDINQICYATLRDICINILARQLIPNMLCMEIG